MVHPPGPGSHDAGSAQDNEIDDGHTTAPAGTGEISSDHDDLEQPTPRAVLVIALRRVDDAAVDRHTER
jgi:hypothetical protein